MSLFSVGKRKKYFNKLGLGEYNTESVKKLQRKYFKRATDIDGIYGKDTDKLLKNIIAVRDNTTNFNVTEFRCPCGRCTGYPEVMSNRMLILLQAIRSYYKRPLIVTSALRCKFENSRSGGVSYSKHLTGQAVDYFINGVTETLAQRKKHIKKIKTFKNHEWSYGNGIDSNGDYIKSYTMGNAVHTQSK